MIGAYGSPAAEEPPRRRISRVRLAVTSLVLFILLLVWYLFMSGQFRAFEVSSTSMLPTLQVGDRLIARRMDPGAMERGQIVVLISPDDEGTDLVKRLVALPGDTIEFRHGQFYLNGIYEPPPPDCPENESNLNFPAEKLGHDSYYVLGDNRPNSHDSQEFGAIGSDRLWGVVFYRYGPSERRGQLQ